MPRNSAALPEALRKPCRQKRCASGARPLGNRVESAKAPRQLPDPSSEIEQVNEENEDDEGNEPGEEKMSAHCCWMNVSYAGAEWLPSSNSSRKWNLTSIGSISGW